MRRCSKPARSPCAASCLNAATLAGETRGSLPVWASSGSSLSSSVPSRSSATRRRRRAIRVSGCWPAAGATGTVRANFRERCGGQKSSGLLTQALLALLVICQTIALIGTYSASQHTIYRPEGRIELRRHGPPACATQAVSAAAANRPEHPSHNIELPRSLIAHYR